MARIALVTSNAFSRQDERLCLEAKGHVVSFKRDVAKALEAILSDPPDLLIIEKGLERSLDREVISALKNNLQLALMPIILVVSERDIATGLDWDSYQVDDIVSSQATVEELLTRIELSLARSHRVADNNPLTKLPGNSSILKSIQNMLDQGQGHAVCYVDIDNFKPYNDKYGFSRGDEVIRMVGRILVNVVQEHCGNEGFVGHVGGDDFVFHVPKEEAEPVCQDVIKSFSALIPLFLDEEDLEKGYFTSKDRQGNTRTFPLTSLSIAVVPCEKGRYSHYGEVAATAARLKKKVKALDGSNYFIDRRSASSGKS